MVRMHIHPLYATKLHTMLSPEYTKLKELITLKVSMSKRHSEILQAMKDLYRNDINSARRFEQITTIGQLLKVLEVRDLLSEVNVLPLEVLAERIPDNTELIKSIKNYEKSQEPRQNINQYATEEIQENKRVIKEQNQIQNQNENSSFSDGLCDKKRERIIKTIENKIGTYWRNLARYLGIQERKIDEIQVNGKKIEEKAREIMEIYTENADRKKWFFDLLDAIEKSRRRELCEELKNIATMNI